MKEAAQTRQHTVQGVIEVTPIFLLVNDLFPVVIRRELNVCLRHSDCAEMDAGVFLFSLIKAEVMHTVF